MFRQIMSEFKYACPVCGQHIKCDSSQSGTVMECPTCFQKIIVPQAPVGEQTYILTGTKVGGDRPAPKTPEGHSSIPLPVKGISGVSVVLLLLVAIAVAVAFVYRGTIFKPRPPLAAKDGETNQSSEARMKIAAPALMAPPANDTNWMLDLKEAVVPDSTAAGRVEGQDFICDRATLQGGLLTLRYGDLSFAIDFTGANPQMLSGKTINVATNAALAAHVTLRWKDGDRSRHETFTNGYALLLDFDEVTNNRIAGKIYLCTSDEEKSYVAGTFKADIRKPRPKRQ
jgi:DNA-directed RNA polymerase subunit RPC12/RpoP